MSFLLRFGAPANLVAAAQKVRVSVRVRVRIRIRARAGVIVRVVLC